MSKNFDALNDQMIINGKNFINTTNKKLKQKVQFQLSATDLETKKPTTNDLLSLNDDNNDDDIYHKFIYIDHNNSNHSLYRGYVLEHELGIMKYLLHHLFLVFNL